MSVRWPIFANSCTSHVPVSVRPAHEASAVLDDLRHGRVIGRAVLAHADS